MQTHIFSIIILTLLLSSPTISLANDFGERDLTQALANTPITLTPSRFKTGLHFLVSHNESPEVVCDYSMNTSSSAPTTDGAERDIATIQQYDYFAKDERQLTEMSGAAICMGFFFNVCSGKLKVRHANPFDRNVQRYTIENVADIRNTYIYTTAVGCNPDTMEMDWDANSILTQQ